MDPETRRALAARVRYYNDLGIYDFYRRPVEPNAALAAAGNEPPSRSPSGTRDGSGEGLQPGAARREPLGPVIEQAYAAAENRVTQLQAIRDDIGDCTRCILHKLGRSKIVFGVGNPQADLMFVGEGPGADEDIQGEPFVGRAGQLLNKMIEAMGLRRDNVYIANVVKCRPPGNRTPEKEECDTCSPFLMRQIEVIQPKVVVALGAVAAKNLLGMNDSMAHLRGRFYDFSPPRTFESSWEGCKLAVTYHPAYLLRDPRQKAEAWKDLQMVMKFLGLKPPAKPSS